MRGRPPFWSPSLKGRSPRLSWWIVQLLIIMLLGGGFTAALLLGEDAESFVLGETDAGLFAAMIIAFAFVNAPVTVRRLHDRGRSGWWAVPYLVGPQMVDLNDITAPFGIVVGADATSLLNFLGGAVSLIVLVDLGIMRGTRGPNRYGPDPLDPEATDDPAEVFD